jgi:uncharacterized RDD family membrane protein YckC
MNTQPPTQTWQAPPEEPGPAPGVLFAGYAARLVAYIVDYVIVGIVFIVIAVVVALVTLGNAFDWSDLGGMTYEDVNGGALAAFVILMLLLVVAAVAYFPWFWWRGGATPGMRLFGIRVVRDRDGGPLTGGQAVMRLIGYWVNSMAVYIGFAWILIDKRRRGWHDLIAGTVVIEDPRR